MDLRIVAQHHTRIEDARRIEQAFDRPHDCYCIIPPLRSDERRHVAASAVLSLEVAAMGEHQFGEGRHECGVTGDFLRAAQIGREREVQVAVLGMTEDDGLFVAMRNEQGAQSAHAGGEASYRKRDILDDHRSARGPHRPDRGEESFANGPVTRHQRRICGEIQLRQAANDLAHSERVVILHFDQQRGRNPARHRLRQFGRHAGQ